MARSRKKAPSRKGRAPSRKKKAPSRKKRAPSRKKKAPSRKKRAPSRKKKAPSRKKKAPSRKKTASKKRCKPVIQYPTPYRKTYRTFSKQDLDVPGTSEYSPNSYQMRHKVHLPDWFPSAEEKLYSNLPNVKKQCSARASFRCPITSYAPGACVPNERMCYHKKMLDAYLSDAESKAIAKSVKSLSSKYGPLFDLAIERLKEGKDPLDDRKLFKMIWEDYSYDKKGELVYKGKNGKNKNNSS